MRIVTETCPNCGTIVAGNVLEAQRVLKCPGLQCDHVLSFDDLSPEERDLVLERVEDSRE